MLTDSQKRQVSAWIGEGLSLAQVQTKIEEEFGVAMTYMDVRFLVDDLDLELKDAAEEKPAADAVPAQAEAAAGNAVPADAFWGNSLIAFPTACKNARRTQMFHRQRKKSAFPPKPLFPFAGSRADGLRFAFSFRIEFPVPEKK